MFNFSITVSESALAPSDVAQLINVVSPYVAESNAKTHSGLLAAILAAFLALLIFVMFFFL